MPARRRRKITPAQFARNQLRKGGLKTGGTPAQVKARFRRLNRQAAQRRRAAGYGRTSASSALAASRRVRKSGSGLRRSGQTSLRGYRPRKPSYRKRHPYGISSSRSRNIG